jgi:hypothetical protein
MLIATVFRSSSRSAAALSSSAVRRSCYLNYLDLNQPKANCCNNNQPNETLRIELETAKLEAAEDWTPCSTWCFVSFAQTPWKVDGLGLRARNPDDPVTHTRHQRLQVKFRICAASSSENPSTVMRRKACRGWGSIVANLSSGISAPLAAPAGLFSADFTDFGEQLEHARFAPTGEQPRIFEQCLKSGANVSIARGLATRQRPRVATKKGYILDDHFRFVQEHSSRNPTQPATTCRAESGSVR